MQTEMARLVVAFIGLCANSMKDLKIKEISMIITFAYGFCGCILRVVGGAAVTDFILSLIPAAVCFLLAFVTREQIGYGDAWVLLATGCCLESGEMLMICMLSLTGISLVALFLCAFLHKNGRFELPYVPFLLAALVCVRGIGL